MSFNKWKRVHGKTRQLGTGVYPDNLECRKCGAKYYEQLYKG